VFDLKKLDWMNGEYLKKLSVDELYTRALEFGQFQNEFFATVGEALKSETYLKRVLAVERDRLARLTDIGLHNPFFFVMGEYEAKMLNWKDNDASMTRASLEQAEKLLENFDDATWSTLTLVEEKLLAEAGDKRGDFLWPLRVALTGAERSPSPAQVAWVLGKDESLARLKQAIAKLV
jgi:glutamyl/glutaminyl-tRNA synthetase